MRRKLDLNVAKNLDYAVCQRWDSWRGECRAGWPSVGGGGSFQVPRGSSDSEG